MAMKKVSYDYLGEKDQKALNFIEHLKDVMGAKLEQGGDYFDSIDAATQETDILISRGAAGVPEEVQGLFDDLDAVNRKAAFQALFDGIRDWELNHGQTVPPDLLNKALYNGFCRTQSGMNKFVGIGSLEYKAIEKTQAIFDSTDGGYSAEGYFPSPVQTGIITSFIAVPPFVFNVAMGNSKGLIAIAESFAANTTGSYTKGDSITGVSSFDCFASATRTDTPSTSSVSGAVRTFASKITQIQATSETCGGNADTKLLRGTAKVYVNGFLMAIEATQNSSSSNVGQIMGIGECVISGVPHLITGTINLLTGAYSISFTAPASEQVVASTISVVVEADLDIFDASTTIAKIEQIVLTFPIQAHPWKASAVTNYLEQKQKDIELGFNARGQLNYSLYLKAANERLYIMLRKIRRVAKNYQYPYSFDWDSYGLQKTMAGITQDFLPMLFKINQDCIQRSHGIPITHLVVGAKMAGIFINSPDVFKRSGVAQQDGFFWLGTFVDGTEVYCSPVGAAETSATSGSNGAAEILCIGRANSPARNPLISGDAISPIIIQGDWNITEQNSAVDTYIGTLYNEINPHQQSAMACALINVTGLRD